MLDVGLIVCTPEPEMLKLMVFELCPVIQRIYFRQQGARATGTCTGHGVGREHHPVFEQLQEGISLPGSWAAGRRQPQRGGGHHADLRLNRVSANRRLVLVRGVDMVAPRQRCSAAGPGRDARGKSVADVAAAVGAFESVDQAHSADTANLPPGGPGVSDRAKVIVKTRKRSR